MKIHITWGTHAINDGLGGGDILSPQAPRPPVGPGQRELAGGRKEGPLLPQGERTTEARRGRKWEERPERSEQRAIISL